MLIQLAQKCNFEAFAVVVCCAESSDHALLAEGAIKLLITLSGVENYSNSRQVWLSRSFLQFLGGLLLVGVILLPIAFLCSCLEVFF